MAVTFIKQPGNPSFSKNPIILRAKTTLHDVTFLRIVCEVTFKNSSNNSILYKETYSAPVEDYGTVTFNLSNASNVYYNLMVRDLMEPWMTYQPLERMEILCYEKWIEGGVEQTGTTTSITSEILILPGGLSDFERMKSSTADIGDILLDNNRLTRKPQEEGVVYPGEILLMPYYNRTNGENATKKISAAGKELYSESLTLYSKAVGTIHFSITEDYLNKEIMTTCSHMRMNSMVRPHNDRVRFLRFINSFGMVENISVCCNDALEYEIESEESTLIGNIDKPGNIPSIVQYRNINRRMNRKKSDIGSYALSSGYVKPNWAEWFVHDVLMSPRAWMLIDGVWVPGDIIPDDSVQMYDRTEPGLQKVDFTFKMGIDGGTRAVFI